MIITTICLPEAKKVEVVSKELAKPDAIKILVNPRD